MGRERHPPGVADVLARLAAHEADTVDVDGLPYRESLQVVRIEGGIANNVVPDGCVARREPPLRARATSSRRRSAQVEALLEGADEIEVINASPAAPPNLWDPLVAELIGTFDLGGAAEARAGPTSPASPRTASRRSTSGRAIRRSRTPRAST